MTSSGPAQGWAVGELARSTGLSVRVLRHWDAMGVVTPARTTAGHRRYRPDDVRRLYQALALRRAGLGLERIRALLVDGDPDPAGTLRAHLTELEADLAARGRLRDRLRAALDGGADAALLMRVIASMVMTEGYVHGYSGVEGARLRDQAGTLADLVHDGIVLPPGSRVLELGCGVGAQSAELLRRHPGIELTAVDRSAESLAVARRRVAGRAAVVQADVDDLPSVALPAGSFDHVFVCFLLEHLPRPVEALGRVHALLAPGGSVTVVEGDHGSVDFHPDSAAARRAVDVQVRLQAQAGGDARIGARLGDLLRDAGFAGVQEEPRVVEVDASTSPRELVVGFIAATFTAMVAGVREPALAAGLTTAADFDAGIADLLATAEPGGRFRYVFTRATGHRPAAGDLVSRR